jgi:hypothetical protein
MLRAAMMHIVEHNPRHVMFMHYRLHRNLSDVPVNFVINRRRASNLVHAR